MSKKTTRNAFRSNRRVPIHVQRMQVEKFRSKDERDRRYRKLKEQKTPGLGKFSTYESDSSMWCVVYK